ncbi:MAG TPA: hypothetical protein DIT01_21445 [Lentisphaeria bacterium]|nr:hypothetical protein [Lentisphaeria bacterium]
MHGGLEFVCSIPSDRWTDRWDLFLFTRQLTPFLSTHRDIRTDSLSAVLFFRAPLPSQGRVVRLWSSMGLCIMPEGLCKKSFDFEQR